MGYMTAKTVVEVVSFSRYACKLFLYLATGRQFRKHLLRLLLRCNKQLQGKWGETASVGSRAGHGAENVRLLLQRSQLSKCDKILAKNTTGIDKAPSGVKEVKTEQIPICDEEDVGGGKLRSDLTQKTINNNQEK